MNDFNEFLNAEREIGEAELKNLEELAGYRICQYKQDTF